MAQSPGSTDLPPVLAGLVASAREVRRIGVLAVLLVVTLACQVAAVATLARHRRLLSFVPELRAHLIVSTESNR